MTAEEIVAKLQSNSRFLLLDEGLPVRWIADPNTGGFSFSRNLFHVHMLNEKTDSLGYKLENWSMVEIENEQPRGFVEFWEDGDVLIKFYAESDYAHLNTKYSSRVAEMLAKMFDAMGFRADIKAIYNDLEEPDGSVHPSKRINPIQNQPRMTDADTARLDMLEMRMGHWQKVAEAKTDGIMIALLPGDPDQYTIEDGEPVDQIHCTVVFIAEDATEFLGDDDSTRLEDIAERLAKEFDPITVHTGKIEQLGDGDPPAQVLLLEKNKILTDLHDRALEVLKDNGYEIEEKWPEYKPHITIVYDADPPEEDFPGEVNLYKLRLAVGRTNYDYDLGSTKESKTAAQGTWNFLPYMEEIGRAYAEAQDDSRNPTVRAAWQELASDSERRAGTLDEQYNTKVVQFEPYETPEQQDYDVRNYNQFLVSDQNSDHPLWTVEQNVAFRKVHDLMGHLPSYGDFSWEGENRACGEHFKLLGPAARTALFVECIMQTAAVNVYQKFLDQKCFIHPNFDPNTGWIPMGQPQQYDENAGVIYRGRGLTSHWQKQARHLDLYPVPVNGDTEDLRFKTLDNETVGELQVRVGKDSDGYKIKGTHIYWMHVKPIYRDSDAFSQMLKYIGENYPGPYHADFNNQKLFEVLNRRYPDKLDPNSNLYNNGGYARIPKATHWKQSVPISQGDWDSWIGEDTNSLHHTVMPPENSGDLKKMCDNFLNILEVGLQPRQGEGTYKGFFQSRDGHVYLGDRSFMDGLGGPYDGVPTFRIKPEYLDPQNMNSDEDSYWPADGPISETEKVFGTLPNWLQQTHPDADEKAIDSLREFGAIAYKGSIPPEALVINPQWLARVSQNLREIVDWNTNPPRPNFTQILYGFDSINQVKKYITRFNALRSSFAKTAGWNDYVAPKAKRLKDEGRVTLIRNGQNYIVSSVRGDTGTYQVEITRLDPNSMAITGWSCECPWYLHAFGRTRKYKKYEGRMCSHAMATFWQSQASPLDDDPTQAPAPFEGAPPVGQAPEAPTPVPMQPAPTESVLVKPGEEIPGTISIPGTFSKVMRDTLDEFRVKHTS